MLNVRYVLMKQILIDSLKMAMYVFLHSVKATYQFFERYPPMISEKGKKILADEEDKERLFEAIRKGDNKVITKQGEISLY